MRIEADRRGFDAERAPEAIARATALIARSLELDLALSRVLAEIDEKRAYSFESCASIGEWARSRGLDAVRATELATLGRALRTTPALEPKVKSGEVTTTAATTVAKVLSKPDLARPGEDWVEAAATKPLGDLRRQVKVRLEEARQQTPHMTTLAIPVTDPFSPLRKAVRSSTVRATSHPRRRRRSSPTGRRSAGSSTSS